MHADSDGVMNSLCPLQHNFLPGLFPLPPSPLPPFLCQPVTSQDDLQVAADGKMCILNLDVKQAMSLTVPNALKALIDPRGGLAEAVKGGLPPGTKEPQIQQAIEAATADIHRAKVSPHMPGCCA